MEIRFGTLAKSTLVAVLSALTGVLPAKADTFSTRDGSALYMGEKITPQSDSLAVVESKPLLSNGKGYQFDLDKYDTVDKRFYFLRHRNTGLCVKPDTVKNELSDGNGDLLLVTCPRDGNRDNLDSSYFVTQLKQPNGAVLLQLSDFVTKKAQGCIQANAVVGPDRKKYTRVLPCNAKNPNQQFYRNAAAIGELNYAGLFPYKGEPNIVLPKSKVVVSDAKVSEGNFLPNVQTRSNKSERYVWLEIPAGLTPQNRQIYRQKLAKGLAGERVYILSHGWNDGPNAEFCVQIEKKNNCDKNFQDLAAAIQKRDPQAVVLLINWSEASVNGTPKIFENSANGLNFYAAKFILPTAKAITPQLKRLRVSFGKATTIGHSLGTHIATSLGKINGGAKNSFLIDPPSTSNSFFNRERKSRVYNYDIDGNQSGNQDPFAYNQGAKYSISLVGDRSLAGNYWVNSANARVQVNLRSGNIEGNSTTTSLESLKQWGSEHIELVKVFAELVHNQRIGWVDLINPEKRGFDRGAWLKEKDILLYVTPKANGGKPSIDFAVVKKQEKVGLLGTDTRVEKNKQFDANYFYSDSSFMNETKYKGILIVGGTGKQNNCKSKFDDTAATNKDDKIDFELASSATLCGYSSIGDPIATATQQDQLVGSKTGANLFVLGNSKDTFYSAIGDKDFAVISNFKPGDKIQVKKGTYSLKVEGTDVKLYYRTIRGDNNLIGVIKFNSSVEAQKMNLSALKQI